MEPGRQHENGMNLFRARWKGIDILWWIVRRQFSWNAADPSILSTAYWLTTWCTSTPVMRERTSSWNCTRKILISQEATWWEQSLGCKWSRLPAQSRFTSITTSRMSLRNMRNTLGKRFDPRKLQIHRMLFSSHTAGPDLPDPNRSSIDLSWRSFSSQLLGSDSILHLRLTADYVLRISNSFSLGSTSPPHGILGRHP